MFPTKAVQPQIPARKLRAQIAVNAGVDVRTVDRFFAREVRTLPIVRDAILTAARNLGVDVEAWS